MAIEQTRADLEAENVELKRKLATLESAAVELRICAQPFTKWSHLSEQCGALQRAVKMFGVALKDIKPTPGHCDRVRDLYARAEHEGEDLRSLADAGDAYRREQPGYRADLEA